MSNNSSSSSSDTHVQMKKKPHRKHKTKKKKKEVAAEEQQRRREEEEEGEEEEEEERENPIAHLKRVKLLNGKDKDSIKSVKFREPRDTQHETQRSLTEPVEAKKHVPLGPLAVLPRRENQNEYTLSPFTRRRGEFPLQEDINTHTVNVMQQQQQSDQNRPNEFAIEDMLSNGFMPFYHSNINSVLATVSNEFYRNAMLVNHANMAAEAAVTEAATVGTEEEDGAATTTVTTKAQQEAAIVSHFNWDVANYGPNNATSKAEMYEKIQQFYENFNQRKQRFFIDDQLEKEVKVGGGGGRGERLVRHRPPQSFAIYREMEEKMGARYAQRLNVMKDSASRTPKYRDEPPIPKHWIESYRLRPLTTDELCARGASCKFNTFSKKDSVRYVARKFESPAEVRDRERNPGEGQHYVRNKEGLCIDCLLFQYTHDCYENVASEEVPLVQMNYFTVLCEPGQYNKECMLPQMLNNRPTGIVGMVPAYNTAKRISIPIKLQQIDGDNLIDISTNYLAETGMDF